MANYWANDNGLWSNVTNWLTAVGDSAGILPTSADDVYANNKIVYIDGDYRVNSIRNISATNITQGGFFVANNGITLSAYVIGGGVANVACLQFLSAAPTTATLVGNLCAGDPSLLIQNPVAFRNSGTGTFNIIGNSDGARVIGTDPFVRVSGIIVNSGGGTLNLNGIYRGVITSGFTRLVTIRNDANCTLFLVGSAFRGTWPTPATNSLNFQHDAIFNSGTVSVSGQLGMTSNQAGATLSLNGLLYENGDNVYGISNSGNVFIRGDVIGTDLTGFGGRGISNTSGNVTIIGTVYGGVAVGGFVSNTSTGTVYIEGYIRGADKTPSSNSSTGAAVNNSGSGIVSVSGRVEGGVGVNNTSLGFGIINSSTGTINITGTVIGASGSTTSSRAVGVLNSGVGTVNILGSATGGSTGDGASNSSTGTMYIRTIVGGSRGIINQSPPSNTFGATNSQNGLLYCEEIEYGPLGVTPISGPVFLVNKRNTVLKMTEPPLGLGQVTLFGNLNVDNLFPPASSVRDGVVYGNGDFTGTMIVPPKEAVQVGVPVGAPGEGGVADPRGTFILSPESFWSFSRSSSALNDPKSIGYRIKNLATIGSVGQVLGSFNFYPPQSAFNIF